VLLAIDYAYIELRTLAAVCEFRYGQSELARVIREGRDPHCHTAAMIRNMSLEEFMTLKTTAPRDFKAARQRAKAINFGVPGGLGAEALAQYARATYGVEMTVDEGAELRKRLVHEVYPELADYLFENLMEQLAANLGATEDVCWATFDFKGERSGSIPAAIRNVVQGRTHKRDRSAYDTRWFDSVWCRLQELNRRDDLAADLAARRGGPALRAKLFGDDAVASLTGRVRARVRYTEARNTPFQALAADGAKLALFRLTRDGFLSSRSYTTRS
jgi:DNA polymerase I-like protein with 3'-5' exonuclease and polymerase domains